MKDLSVHVHWHLLVIRLFALFCFVNKYYLLHSMPKDEPIVFTQGNPSRPNELICRESCKQVWGLKTTG